MMNGARVVLECLRQEGVELVFGYPGGVVLPLYDEIYKERFPHVLPKHEQGAVHAADGYARASGKVGVAIATSGPGATNLVTGIATANMDSVPLVCITGQVNKRVIGKDSFQEADVSGITTPITKYNYIVKSAAELPRVMKEAFFIARTGRPGPVVVDIATNAFAEQIDFAYPATTDRRGYNGKFDGNAVEIDAFVDALKAAKRPLFFIGGGVTMSESATAMREVIARTGIPVTTTLMGIGCADPDDGGLLGMAGMHGSYAANMAIQECDLLIAVGMRFDDRVTGIVAEFAPQAKVAHFEIDAAEINKNVRVDFPVHGDLRWSLPILRGRLEALPRDFAASIADWRAHVIDMNRQRPFAYDRNAATILPQRVIEEVNALCDDDTIIVTDVGQHQMWAAQFYRTRHPRHFLTSGGLGTMGYGLPAAIGAKLARPKQRVVLFTGDGSIMMNCQELSTAADYHVDVKIIVLHNHMLGMVAQWQRMFYHEHYSQSELNGHTDFVRLAEAMGVRGLRVSDPAQLTMTLRDALETPGATLVDVEIPPTENVLPMVPGGKRLDQMTLFEGGESK